MQPAFLAVSYRQVLSPAGIGTRLKQYHF